MIADRRPYWVSVSHYAAGGVPAGKARFGHRSGRDCRLEFLALPLIRFIAAPFLPGEVFWFPFWLGAVTWNGADGQGGISHLLGQ